MAHSSLQMQHLPGNDAPVRPMFTARADRSPESDEKSNPASQYVLFEQSPITGNWMLQGASTRKLHALWEQQERVAELPVLSSFRSSDAADILPFMIIHQVHRAPHFQFEVDYVGAECAEIVGMSRERRMLASGPDQANTNDVLTRLLDVAENQHPHFCVKTLGWQGRDMMKYEALLLPFGEVGFDGVVAIVSVLSFSNGFDPKCWSNSSA